MLFPIARDFYDYSLVTTWFIRKYITRDPGAAGICDAADITFLTVPAGGALEAIVIFKATGTPATSPLVAYMDTATGLPVTPNGGDINVAWDNGANKIFKL